MYVHVHMPRITYEGQRTTRRSCFSPSTVWAPGIELRSSVVASAFSHLVQPDWFKPPACLESFKLELNFGNTVFPCNDQKRMSNLYWRKRALSCKPRYLTCCKALIVPVKKNLQRSSQAHQDTWSESRSKHWQRGCQDSTG